MRFRNKKRGYKLERYRIDICWGKATQVRA